MAFADQSEHLFETKQAVMELRKTAVSVVFQKEDFEVIFSQIFDHLIVARDQDFVFDFSQLDLARIDISSMQSLGKAIDALYQTILEESAEWCNDQGEFKFRFHEMRKNDCVVKYQENIADEIVIEDEYPEVDIS